MEISIDHSEQILFSVKTNDGLCRWGFKTMNDAVIYAEGLASGYNAACAKLGKAHIFHSHSCMGKS